MQNIDIAKIVANLPYEANEQITECYCVDEDKEVSELTLEEVISEVEWTVERLKMDIDELNPEYDAETIKDYRLQLAACNKFLAKYRDGKEATKKPRRKRRTKYNILSVVSYTIKEENGGYQVFATLRLENKGKVKVVENVKIGKCNAVKDVSVVHVEKINKDCAEGKYWTILI